MSHLNVFFEKHLKIIGWDSDTGLEVCSPQSKLVYTKTDEMYKKVTKIFDLMTIQFFGVVVGPMIVVISLFGYFQTGSSEAFYMITNAYEMI